MEQMTKEEAIAFHDSKAWEPLSYRERAELQLFQDKLCMPLAVFHEAIMKALGRPVYTHEFGLNREGLKQELSGHRPPPSLQEIIELVPAEKRIVIAPK